MKYKELNLGDCFTTDIDNTIYIHARGDDYTITSHNSILIGKPISFPDEETNIHFVPRLPIASTISIYTSYETPTPSSFKIGDQFCWQTFPGSKIEYMMVVEQDIVVICNGGFAGETMYLNFKTMKKCGTLSRPLKLFELYEIQRT